MAQNPKLLRAYLAVGADELKRETAVKRLKSRLDAGLADFNLDERQSASDIAVDEILSSLNTMPFGPGFRLIIIHDADKLAKNVSEAIVSYLSDPNPGSVLLLECESLAKTTRLYKAVLNQGKQSIIDCSMRKRWEMPPYVMQLAQAKGISISQDGAEELLNRVGTSTVMIDSQLALLAEHMGRGARVTSADVERLVARTAEVTPWEMLDSLSARKVGRALELYRLMPEDTQVSLLALINGRVRELICARSLIERGRSNELAEELGVQSWRVKNHLGWARGFRDGELESLLVAGAACEQDLKGSRDSETAFIEHLLRFADTR
ncbi:MAG: DNA polymerase III subunit delta [Atopobiaceae bacterium]|nr:DNA polymerase III subunit delta [Atopobiaceae bacterium]